MKSMLWTALIGVGGLFVVVLVALLVLAARSKPLPPVAEALASLPESERAALDGLARAAGIESTNLRPIGISATTLEHPRNVLSVGIAGGHVRTVRISGTRLTACPDISELSALEALSLDRNALASWPDLRGLSVLRHLDLTSNQLATVSSSDSVPPLSVLRLRGNRLTNAAPLARFSALRELDLSGNPLESFDALVPLKLDALDLSNTRISSLPPALPNKSASRWEVDLDGTPVLNPPGVMANRTYTIVNPARHLGTTTRRGLIDSQGPHDVEGTASQVAALALIEIATHKGSSGIGAVILEASIQTGKARIYLRDTGLKFQDPWFKAGFIKGFGFLQQSRWVYADLEGGRGMTRLEGGLERGAGPNGEYEFQIEPLEGTEVTGLRYRVLPRTPP